MTGIETEARAEAERRFPKTEWTHAATLGAFRGAFEDGYLAGASRPASPALDEQALGDVIEAALHDAAMVDTRGFPSGEPEEWVSEPAGLLVGTITKAVLAALPPVTPATEWACGKCGGNSVEHARIESNCVWEPVLVPSATREAVTEEMVRAGAYVLDEGAMDAPEDYPLAYEAAMSQARDVLETALDIRERSEPAPSAPAPKRRLRSCVEAWPEASTGEYNPSCCRFPKSCSATVYDEQRVSEADLEPSERSE